MYAEHLSASAGRDESLLIKSLKLFHCYTSVLNAAEIFSGCENKIQTEKAKNSFFGSSVLGIPYKYSLSSGEILRKIRQKKLKNTYRDALIVSLCKETNLPFLSLNAEKYRDLFRIFGIRTISRELIIHYKSPEEIFNKAKI
ncbi:MAG: hypothetical protein JNJ56_13240 [Ignavibacteria bacterium]|nr:hypothetical protein [Ignavibacteria bacterium]